MNKECEHEWVIYANRISCKQCGQIKHIDFKIPENLEQINKQQWEDIENEFKNERQFKFWSDVFDWLKEKYFAPEKK